MALNQREKIMVGLVVVLVTVAVGVLLIRGDSSTELASRKAALDAEIKELGIKIGPGEDAAKNLAELRSRSLPEDTDAARDLYNDWLSELAIDKVEFENATIKPLAIRTSQSYYSVLPFTINADGSLEQLTRFLHEFYSVNYLHKVVNLVISPIEDSSHFSLTIQIQAMCLPDAVAKDALPEGPADRLQHDELDEYLAMIVRRRMEQNEPGDRQPYRYGLEPTGLFAYYKEAETTWDWDGSGGNDDGSGGVRDDDDDRPIRVIPFDHSQYTFLNAINEVNGKAEIWLHVRTLDCTLKVHVGESFEVGQISGKVAEIRIDRNDVLIETEAGLRRIVLGECIRDHAPAPPRVALEEQEALVATVG